MNIFVFVFGSEFDIRVTLTCGHTFCWYCKQRLKYQYLEGNCQISAHSRCFDEEMGSNKAIVWVTVDTLDVNNLES